jgi:hypothetical protein
MCCSLPLPLEHPSSPSLSLARRMMPLPRLFLQLFELSDDHRSRRRLQSPLAVASGSTSHCRPRIRDRRHLLNIVYHSIAAVHHRSKLAVNPLDALAGFRLAGEPSPLLFFSCPRICIAWPKLEGLTEMVSANSAAPCRPGRSAPQSNQSN